MIVALSKKDFESDQEVRWCPGCGDYSVLAAVQRFLPSLGIAPENYVFVSGIGCSSRFPYYMNTYGFHTIHGRAPAIATGVKCANPELSVWMVTGDGDSLSIGGNHLMHLLRRNVDINVLLLNNRIYGLTKGQYSPTSELGKITKSTPYGSPDHPVNPLLFALGSQATFLARTIDGDAKHMTDVLKCAAEHRGCSFVEIFQNCNIFNDGAFAKFAERDVRDDQTVRLEHGKLMVFGKQRDKGLGFDGFAPKVIEFAPGDEAQAEALGVARHDQHNQTLAFMLANLEHPEFPVPVGVVFQRSRETFDHTISSQMQAAKLRAGSGSVDERLAGLYRSGDTWSVE